MARTMSKRKISRMYEEHKDYVKKLSAEYGRCVGGMKSHSLQEELFSVCELEFVQAAMEWDMTKASFKTYFTRRAVNSMKDFIQKSDQPVDPVPYEMTASSIHFEWSVDHCMRLQHLLDSVTEEARYVIEMLLDVPAETLQLLGTEPPKILRGKIVQHLIQKQKIDKNKAYGILREVKVALGGI